MGVSGALRGVSLRDGHGEDEGSPRLVRRVDGAAFLPLEHALLYEGQRHKGVQGVVEGNARQRPPLPLADGEERETDPPQLLCVYACVCVRARSAEVPLRNDWGALSSATAPCQGEGRTYRPCS